KRPKKSTTRAPQVVVKPRRKMRAMSEDVSGAVPGAGRIVAATVDDAGNVVEKEQPALGRRAGRRKTDPDTMMPQHQHARAYVPGRVHVNPKSGTTHKDN